MRYITSSKQEKVESLLNIFHDLSLRATSEGSLYARKTVQSWVSTDLNQWQGCMSVGGNLINSHSSLTTTDLISSYCPVIMEPGWIVCENNCVHLTDGSSQIYLSFFPSSVVFCVRADQLSLLSSPSSPSLQRSAQSVGLSGGRAPDFCFISLSSKHL